MQIIVIRLSSHFRLACETDFFLCPHRSWMADKKRNEFLTVDVGRKSQSHICRRLLDGHLGRRRKATDENSRDGRTNSIHAQGFYVYLEVITSHNPLFRAIILFAVWIAADLNAVAELLWTVDVSSIWLTLVAVSNILRSLSKIVGFVLAVCRI